MPGYNSQRRGTARTLPKLIVLFCELFVCKCVMYYCHRVSKQLQLTNIYLILLSLLLHRAFSSVVRQMPGYNSQIQGTAHTLHKLIVLFYVLFVCKCVLYCCHRVTTQLHLTNISISVYISRNMYLPDTNCNKRNTQVVLIVCNLVSSSNFRKEVKILRNVPSAFC